MNLPTSNGSRWNYLANTANRLLNYATSQHGDDPNSYNIALEEYSEIISYLREIDENALHQVAANAQAAALNLDWSIAKVDHYATEDDEVKEHIAQLILRQGRLFDQWAILRG